MREYVFRHRVTFDETNVVGNVYFAHYLHWQGHCREAFLADHAPGVLREVRRGELALATVSCAMEYFAECFALDEIEVAMTLRGRRGNRVEMDYEFRRCGRLVARGGQVVSCLRRTASGVLPVRVPDELSAALAPFVKETP
ncbi:acyl-CoA thioesterase [Goodfellowiella coeruleoviolacea]|uniref:Enediyne biosynthesis thioesterase n=1 Tax=Goodfellowiella coeruleoviolacea TaxID=334858 RepID=A0AAE3GHZ7_9PSEU|nr:acyl-CoA thioesterase [Goodfellowiella coeruleoviolacea]MCP2167742.1 enediyne biosynthesis thioesterase [Goodfellowiella coeruleoviolacea]